jgi:ectoine hydroxylase-related dioxygenase (phytanoyl-CoA dioxygenase family)
MSIRSFFAGRSQQDLQADPPVKYEPAWPSVPAGADPYRDPVHAPRHRSRFGGCWTDLSNAREVAAGKRALGLISDAEHELLRDWVEHGYVILRNAIPHDWIDAHNDDIETVWRSGHPSAWVSAIENGNGITRQLQIGDFEKTDNLVKLMDVYEYLESARLLAFAPAIQRFLELVFERSPLAHQSLSFYRGSKQPIHQDTAFVRVSSPLELTASWIALEDVQPGSGELEYYEGSHDFPEFLFDGRDKWLAPGNNQLGDYYDHLRRCAEERSLAPVRFLPQKGDVLIWSADLAHGGSAYTDSSRTRRSLVTHYTPVDCHPMYFHYGDHSGKQPWGSRSYWCAMKKYLWSPG